MAWDLTIMLKDEPGTLANLGEATGAAGINLGGVCGVVVGGEGIIHVLVEDPDAAAAAIEQAGMSVRDRREVLVVDVEDRPGELGRVARRLADAGVNIEVVYLATGTRLVLGVSDLAAARQALGV